MGRRRGPAPPKRRPTRPARCTDSQSVPEIRELLGQQFRESLDELFGGVDRCGGAVQRYVGIGPQPVIADLLDVAGLAEELAKLAIEPRLTSRQPGKLGMHALMGLGVFACALHDQRLRRVKGSEVGIAAGFFTYSGGENSLHAGQALTSFLDMLLPPALQIDAFSANFLHQRGAIFMGARG